MKNTLSRRSGHSASSSFMGCSKSKFAGAEAAGTFDSYPVLHVKSES